MSTAYLLELQDDLGNLSDDRSMVATLDSCYSRPYRWGLDMDDGEMVLVALTRCGVDQLTVKSNSCVRSHTSDDSEFEVHTRSEKSKLLVHR